MRIATGLVEPHFMAGYSGGRKVIAPGVAHVDTIRSFHSARFMENPYATSCVLENNPLHEEQLQMVKRIGESYALNVVIDEERDLVFASFGETIASHAAAVDFVRDWVSVPVDRRFKTVVTSAAGFPLDQTYYQTVKRLADVDGWQSEMQLRTTRVATVTLYAPALEGADRQLTGVDVIDSVDKALRDAVERAGDDAVAVIPEGPYVIPRFASTC